VKQDWVPQGNNFFNKLWEQAAAEGITVFVSAGDAGSAGCDDFTKATVAYFRPCGEWVCFTPFNVAVAERISTM